MKPVWINVSNNVYVINYAYEKDGVIFYPDMIKVRVCAETNTVIGLEATSYYANHFERNIDKPILTKAQARTKVKTEMEIETCRLAVIPIGNSSEMLCYEFSGKLNGATYYAYIDAKSGRQAELFKVVENTEGTLLM
jgi:spore germination protein